MHFPNLGGWKSIFGTQVSFVTLCCWASHVVQLELLELNETMAAVPISSRFLGHIICTSHVSQRLFHDFIMRHSLFWLLGSSPPENYRSLSKQQIVQFVLAHSLSQFFGSFFRHEPTPCTSQKIPPPEVDPWLKLEIHTFQGPGTIFQSFCLWCGLLLGWHSNIDSLKGGYFYGCWGGVGMEGEGTINLLKVWIVVCLGQIMEGYHYMTS